MSKKIGIKEIVDNASVRSDSYSQNPWKLFKSYKRKNSPYIGYNQFKKNSELKRWLKYSRRKKIKSNWLLRMLNKKEINMNVDLFNTTEKIRVVSSERNYWFIRTYSGLLFDDYFENGYVGIGFNQVPVNLITFSYSNDGKYHIDKLKEYIEKNSRYQKGEATKWSFQLVDFLFKVKKGDIVIIPSKNSYEFAIGEIDSEIYVIDDNRRFHFEGNQEKYPQKRKNVKWITRKKRHEFKGELDKMLSSSRAITNVRIYRETIESHISNLFMLEDKTYLSIEINNNESINAFALSNFLDSITYFYTELCKENGIETDEELFIKIKVQSKGRTVLSGFVAAGFIGLGIIYSLSDNPDIKLNLGTYGKFEATGDGVLQSISKFLDAKQERQIKMIQFQKANDTLKAETDYTPEKFEIDNPIDDDIQLDHQD